MGSDLTDQFDQARMNVTGKALDALRQAYFIQATMRGNDEASIGGIRVNTSGRLALDEIKKKKEKQQLDDLILLSILNDRIAAIENNLADKYGEDFAENLAAELLDTETYRNLMMIDDKTERRDAIANAINDGINNGTVDEQSIVGNEDFEQWLNVHEEKRRLTMEIEMSQIQNVDTSNNVDQHQFGESTEEVGAFDTLFDKTP